jgi:hypothetical protein
LKLRLYYLFLFTLISAKQKNKTIELGAMAWPCLACARPIYCIPERNADACLAADGVPWPSASGASAPPSSSCRCRAVEELSQAIRRRCQRTRRRSCAGSWPRARARPPDAVAQMLKQPPVARRNVKAWRRELQNLVEDLQVVSAGRRDLVS